MVKWQALLCAALVGAWLGAAAPTDGAVAQTAAGTGRPAQPGEVRINGRLHEMRERSKVPADQPLPVPNYRKALRDTVIPLADYAEGRDPGFLLLSREGIGLLIKSEREAKLERLALEDLPEEARVPTTPVGTLHRRYARGLDGVIMDDQYCGPMATASDAFVDMLQDNGLNVLAVDHCASTEAAARAYRHARRDGIVLHVDTGDGPTERVPGWAPYGENADNVTTLADARNMLVLDSNSGYGSKDDYVGALRESNFDILVIDPFYRNTTALTAAEVRDLRFKKLGARRLVLARMNLTHAQDTRWYWKDSWDVGTPEWIFAPVPGMPGTYEVDYWRPDWREITGRTFAGLMELGFDGVVLEGMDIYKPLEKALPLN